MISDIIKLYSFAMIFSAGIKGNAIYGGLDAWPIQTEFTGMSLHFLRVGDVPAHGISLQHPMIYWQNVEESCTFQKIYGVGKVKLQRKWSDRLEKTQI